MSRIWEHFVEWLFMLRLRGYIVWLLLMCMLALLFGRGH